MSYPSEDAARLVPDMPHRWYHQDMNRCIMFDFDGVIVDSERYALELLVRIMRENYSISVTEEDAVHVIGYNTARTLSYLNSRYGTSVDLDDYVSKYSLYGNYYMDYEGLSPIEGAAECIESIRGMGYSTGLVSSTRSKHILYALSRMKMVGLFDFIVTGDMVEKSKPDPEPYLKGLAFSGCSKHDCMIIEDSPAGIASAKAAGIFAVGFKAASVKLDTSGADAIINSYEELGKWVKDRL